MAYFIFILILALIVFILYWLIEMAAMYIKDISPKIPSQNRMRAHVADQIHKEMPDVKTVLDIGACSGGMVFRLAKGFPDAMVSGIEIMPAPYILSQIYRIFRPRNTKFHLGNALNFIKDRHFDVAVCYLLPGVMGKIQEYADHFDMIFVLDFPFPDLKPYKKITLHSDFMGDHVLYVYRS
ncbi:hypothetical protein FACS18945_3760 [Bacteroidia bacterium]|nr:hypothetical protein FACS18945_3760 [Bacteroidia bacterium]